MSTMQDLIKSAELWAETAWDRLTYTEKSNPEFVEAHFRVGGLKAGHDGVALSVAVGIMLTRAYALRDGAVAS